MFFDTDKVEEIERRDQFFITKLGEGDQKADGKKTP